MRKSNLTLTTKEITNILTQTLKKATEYELLLKKIYVTEGVQAPTTPIQYLVPFYSSSMVVD
jgi:hypothetical protein